MTDCTLSWHNAEAGYLDLRSTNRVNQIRSVEHLRQYFMSDLGKCRFIWAAPAYRLPGL